MGSVPLALIGSVAACGGGPAAFRCFDDRLHHADRHCARNGILKVSHYINLAIHEGMPYQDRDAMQALVMRGSLERLTPVLMTALSAGVALVPLMIDAHAPGKEILHRLPSRSSGAL